MELQKIVSDLLLSSDNPNWMRRVLISTHIISDKINIYDKDSRNFFEDTNKYNYQSFKNGEFSQCDVIAIVDRIIDVYFVSRTCKRNKSKRILNVIGYNSTIKDLSKGTLRTKIMKKKEEFSFLQDSEYKIIYFPYPKENNEIFHIFREIGKNTFLIDSLSNNLNNPDLNVKSGFKRRDIVDMVLDEIYE